MVERSDEAKAQLFDEIEDVRLAALICARLAAGPATPLADLATKLGFDLDDMPGFIDGKRTTPIRSSRSARTAAERGPDAPQEAGPAGARARRLNE